MFCHTNSTQNGTRWQFHWPSLPNPKVVSYLMIKILKFVWLYLYNTTIITRIPTHCHDMALHTTIYLVGGNKEAPYFNFKIFLPSCSCCINVSQCHRKEYTLHIRYYKPERKPHKILANHFSCCQFSKISQNKDKKYVNKKERERHLPGYCQWTSLE